LVKNNYFSKLKTTRNMKRCFTKTAWFVALYAFLNTTILNAQVAGDYRTRGALTTPLNLNWDGATTWQIYNGTTLMWDITTTPPSASAPVQIRSNHNVTVNVANAACKSVDFTGGSVGSSLTILTGNTLAVAGIVAIQQPTSGSNKVTVAGTLTATDMDLKAVADAGKLSELIIDNGTITLTTDVTALGTSSRVIFQNGGTLNLGKNFMSGGASGTLTAGTGTINLTGTTIQNLGGYTYNNINVTGTGTPIFIGAATIGGTFDNTTNNNGVKIRANLTVNGPFNAGTGTYTFDGGTLPATYALAGNLSIAKITIVPQITVNSTATLTNGGIFTNDGIFINNGSFTKTAAAYKGTGTFSGNTFVNATSVSPDENALITDDSLACMTFGSYDNGMGILDLDFLGTTACTQFDQLNVSGTFNASGVLKLDFGPFTPSVGQTFTIVSGASSFTGAFTNINETPNNITASYADGIVTIVSTTVPVELSRFDVKRQPKSTLLAWTTESESNNEAFHIEQSTDGKNFQTIGKVKGYGNSTIRQNYNFEHNTPSVGINYYRLKQVDFDGKTTYSPTRSILFGRKDFVLKSTLVQNTLDVIVSDEAALSLHIFNLSGQEVFQTKAQGEQRIYVGTLPHGLYFIRTDMGDVARFVKE
jgi:hypothetical protein